MDSWIYVNCLKVTCACIEFKWVSKCIEYIKWYSCGGIVNSFKLGSSNWPWWYFVTKQKGTLYRMNMFSTSDIPTFVLDRISHSAQVKLFLMKTRVTSTGKLIINFINEFRVSNMLHVKLVLTFVTPLKYYCGSLGRPE